MTEKAKETVVKTEAKDVKQQALPHEIEQASMAILQEELLQRGVVIPPAQAPVVHRVIHATADFDFAETLCFSKDAVAMGVLALKQGADIVTDTAMAKAGISRQALEQFNGQVFSFTGDPAVAELAKKEHTTRSAAAMVFAARNHPCAIRAVGNAPTALLQLAEQIKGGLRPALVIAVPVGFVNVEESKLRIWDVCREHRIPIIAAMGRKGGSTVAAAICNALLYTAAGWLDPEARSRQQNGITGDSK